MKEGPRSAHGAPDRCPGGQRSVDDGRSEERGPAGRSADESWPDRPVFGGAHRRGGDALGVGYLLPCPVDRSFNAISDRRRRRRPGQPLPGHVSAPRHPGDAPPGQAWLAGDRADRGGSTGGCDDPLHDLLFVPTLRRDLRAAANPAADRDPAGVDHPGRTPAPLATIAEMAYPVAATFIASAPPPYGFNQPLYLPQFVGTGLLIAVIFILNWSKERTPPVIVQQDAAA